METFARNTGIVVWTILKVIAMIVFTVLKMLVTVTLWIIVLTLTIGTFGALSHTFT